jgi:hypothetical protein
MCPPLVNYLDPLVIANNTLVTRGSTLAGQSSSLNLTRLVLVLLYSLSLSHRFCLRLRHCVDTGFGHGVENMPLQKARFEEAQEVEIMTHDKIHY